MPHSLKERLIRLEDFRDVAYESEGQLFFGCRFRRLKGRHIEELMSDAIDELYRELRFSIAWWEDLPDALKSVMIIVAHWLGMHRFFREAGELVRASLTGDVQRVSAALQSIQTLPEHYRAECEALLEQ